MFKDSEITKSEGTGHPLKFTDAGAIPAWARTSMGAAVAIGIVAGYPDNTLQKILRGINWDLFLILVSAVSPIALVCL